MALAGLRLRTGVAPWVGADELREGARTADAEETFERFTCGLVFGFPA